MSDETQFKCNKCGGTPDADSSPDGRAHFPFEGIPVNNQYWQKVATSTCSYCWEEWKGMEIKIVNEYRLNLLERDHRKLVKKYMHDFLNVDGTSDAAGAAPAAVAEAWKPEG
jgi:Fe-S cluster biosynthesis and repair protein YggX